jgi:hypothetical protein
MKQIIITAFAFIVSVNSFCQTSENLNSVITDISNQLGIKENSFAVKNSISRKLNSTEIKFIESKNDFLLNPKLDLENAVAYVIENNNGVSIISISIQYENSDKILNYIYDGTDYLLQNLTAIYNSENGNLYLNLESVLETNTTERWASWSAWTGCMTNFFGSNVGTFVNIMGIAGGVGCTGCTVVAGAVTGVMMIACTQAH